MDVDYVNHGLGIHPSGAGGQPWTGAYVQSKGDPITDMYENMAASQYGVNGFIDFCVIF